MNNDEKLINQLRSGLDKLLVALPFLSVFFVRWGIDPDTYWIIKTGEYIWNNGIPTKDFLSMHTNMDLVVQQWISSIIYYKAYDLLGPIGLMLIVIATFIAFVCLFRKLCSILTDNKYLVCGATLTAGLLINTFFTTRPQIFTYSIILIELICLESYIKDKKIKHLFVLPILSMLIVNLHASMWTMQFIVMLPYLCQALPIKIKGKSLQCCKLLPLIASLIAMASFGLITPYGVKGLSFIFTASVGGKVNSSIQELHPVSLALDITSLSHVFIIALPILAFLVYKKGKYVLRHILLALGTMAMALMYLKLLPYFIVCAYPITIAYLGNIDFSFILKKIKENSDESSNPRLRKILISLILAILIAIPTYCVYSFVSEGVEYVSTESVSGYLGDIGQATDALASDLKKKGIDKDDIIMYNGFNTGGYLEFLGYKTYMDARADSFIVEANNDFDYLTEYFDMKNGKIYYKDVFNKYNFNYAFVAKGSEINIYTNLSHDDDFVLVFENDDYAVFSKA